MIPIVVPSKPTNGAVALAGWVGVRAQQGATPTKEQQAYRKAMEQGDQQVAAAQQLAALVDDWFS